MEPWITYQTCGQEATDMTHTRPTTSNFEQVVNLPYSQANSASYPQRDEKQVASSTMRWGASDWVVQVVVRQLASVYLATTNASTGACKRIILVTYRYWTAADTQHVIIFVPRQQAHTCYNRNFRYLAYVYLAAKVHRSTFYSLATALMICQKPAINIPLSTSYRDNAADQISSLYVPNSP